MAKKRLVVGNWKMYIETPDAAKSFATLFKRRSKVVPTIDAWVAPSFTLLPTLAVAFKGTKVKVGGQAASPHAVGAHTGEVSAKMLKAAGASFSIVGHSERRAMGAIDRDVHDEFVAVLQAGLTAILCVGETERAPDGSHFARIEEQVRTAAAGMQAFAGKIVIAYEPVWAIGKTAAEAMQPHDLEETVIFIRKTLTQVLGREAGLKVPILYGGSVDGDNTAALLSSGVHGFLVGRASAAVDSFIEILKACKK